MRDLLVYVAPCFFALVTLYIVCTNDVKLEIQEAIQQADRLASRAATETFESYPATAATPAKPVATPAPAPVMTATPVTKPVANPAANPMVTGGGPPSCPGGVTAAPERAQVVDAFLADVHRMPTRDELRLYVALARQGVGADRLRSVIASNHPREVQACVEGSAEAGGGLAPDGDASSRLVRSMFRALLARDPTDDEMAQYLAHLAGGMTGADALEALASTEEFAERKRRVGGGEQPAGAGPGTTLQSDEEVQREVIMAFNVVLDRNPSAKELQEYAAVYRSRRLNLFQLNSMLEGTAEFDRLTKLQKNDVGRRLGYGLTQRQIAYEIGAVYRAAKNKPLVSPEATAYLKRVYALYKFDKAKLTDYIRTSMVHLSDYDAPEDAPETFVVARGPVRQTFVSRLVDHVHSAASHEREGFAEFDRWRRARPVGGGLTAPPDDGLTHPPPGPPPDVEAAARGAFEAFTASCGGYASALANKLYDDLGGYDPGIVMAAGRGATAMFEPQPMAAFTEPQALARCKGFDRAEVGQALGP